MGLWLRHNRLSIARFLFGFYLVILVSGIVFRHAHRLSDGTIITHSHPYIPIGKSPFQPNNHTQQEIAWLDVVGNALFDNPDTTPFTVALVILGIILTGWTYCRDFFSTNQHTRQYRGPPVVHVASTLLPINQ